MYKEIILLIVSPTLFYIVYIIYIKRFPKKFGIFIPKNLKINNKSTDKAIFIV